MMTIYRCESCQRLYAVPNGVPIRCRYCQSKSRTHLGDCDAHAAINYLLNATPAELASWQHNVTGELNVSDTAEDSANSAAG